MPFVWRDGGIPCLVAETLCVEMETHEMCTMN
jgi:hypothetical protein